jgi:hypothetical protein
MRQTWEQKDVAKVDPKNKYYDFFSHTHLFWFLFIGQFINM